MLLRRDLNEVRVYRAKRLLSRANPLFLAIVVLPTIVATIYFGMLASDVYVSQSQFVVRSPDKPATSGLGVLLKSVGFSNAGDEIFITQDYVRSRDALRSLNENGKIARAYGSPDISVFNRFNPYGWNGSFEDLYEYYRGKVGVEHNTTSSITTLTVRAFTPQDARRTNQELLDLAEGLVNRLNNRGEFDLLSYAQRETREADAEARRASQALAAFRNTQGIVDPERQATVQLQLVSKLQDEVIGFAPAASTASSAGPGEPADTPLADEDCRPQQADQRRARTGGRRSTIAIGECGSVPASGTRS